MSQVDEFLRDYSTAVLDQTASVFVGAGLSRAAGYPSWKELLREIALDLGVEADDLSDLAALAQWKIRQDSGRTKVIGSIKRQIAVAKPVPAALGTLARLPVRSYWTTNYDELLEKALTAAGRPYEVRSSESSLSFRPIPGAAQILKMHGTIADPADMVISTDDYELFRRDRGTFLTLLQSQMTTTMFLFAGMSLTDPNVRHVLSLIRERFRENPPEHFAIVRPPQPEDFDSTDVFSARILEHKYWAEDLKRYGLKVVEIQEYSEIDALLKRLERRVAKSQVWISGSWPLDAPGEDTAHAHLVHDVAAKLGESIFDRGLNLITGSGLFVGSATISGFVAAAQRSGYWDLTRRLIARPFPQPPNEGAPNKSQWSALRKEMARLAGSVVVVGGSKVVGGRVRVADGVLEEVALAEAEGALIIPVGATGGAAKHIAKQMLGGKVPRSSLAKEDVAYLLHSDRSAEEIVARVMSIILNRAND